MADAGPLIHLGEVGRPDAFRIFEAVVVPGPILAEVAAGGDPAPPWLAKPPFRARSLISREERAAEAASLRYDIGVADAAVLTAGRAEGLRLVLTDDLGLRQAARLAGLEPVGSVGILLRAAAWRVLSVDTADRALRDLRERSSLFITDALVEEARRRLRERLGA